MAKQQKNEAVTATFHYLVREELQDGKDPKVIPFSQDEFDDLCNAIKNQKSPNLKVKEEFRQVKYGQIVPFHNAVSLNDQCLFGAFEGAYSGHAFTNSDKGDISADSINQRKFHFLLYLSDTGKIYIGAQYLGNYGDWTGLRHTIVSLLPNQSTIQSYTFRQDEVDFTKAVAKEVRVSLSRNGESLESKNLFSQSSMIAVRKKSKEDGFEDKVQKTLIPLMMSSIDKRKQAIAELLTGSDLYDVKDNDIENCTIVASVNGRDRVIYMFGGANFASRFKLDVELKVDGHPKYDQTKKAMYDVLRDEIISRKEDV